MKINKYIGDRQFYKMAMTVALPITAQNFISSFVNMLDNLMVGKLGTEQMSGVSIVNQLIFIFNLAIFGSLSGIGIFTAQFHGKGDEDGIRHTLRFKLFASIGLTAVASALFIAFQDPLIKLFLHESEGSNGDLAATLNFGKDYFYIALIGLLPFALTQALGDTMKQTGDTVTPMIAGLAGVIINCVFNYFLIFGKFIFPEMGVRGAAAATVLSRFCELFIILIYILMHRKRFPYIVGLFKSFKIPVSLLRSFVSKGTPLLINELLWSGGMSMLSIAFSMHGLMVVAAYSISSTISNLFSMACLSMGSAIGIIAGQYLGAGEDERAIDAVRKLTAFSVTLAIALGVALFFLGGPVTHLYNTDEEARELAKYFLRVFGCIMPAMSFANAAYFVMRSGGRTFVTFLFDSVFMWVISVPTAFALYYVLHLNIYYLFPIVQGLEIIKCVVGYIMMKKRVWVRSIV